MSAGIKYKDWKRDEGVTGNNWVGWDRAFRVPHHPIKVDLQGRGVIQIKPNSTQVGQYYLFELLFERKDLIHKGAQLFYLKVNNIAQSFRSDNYFFK